MPKYDFKCPHCDLVFEAVRGFAEAADPALCPRDGAPSGRLFTPPADILVRGGFRDSVARKVAAAARPTWSHDDLSCHTHEPAPAEHSDGHRDSHADSSAHGHPHGHSHEHGHGHSHGHGHTHGNRHSH